MSPQGDTTVTTKGLAGGECREASRLLEQALGTRAKETLTSEFYQQAQASNRVQEGS